MRRANKLVRHLLEADDSSPEEIKRQLSSLPEVGSATLYVDADTARVCDDILNRPAEERLSGRTMFDKSVRFSDNCQMDIQVIGPEDVGETGWCQGVLFDESGMELGHTDVGESFLGDYTVQTSAGVYTCKVVIGEPPDKWPPNTFPWQQ